MESLLCGTVGPASHQYLLVYLETKFTGNVFSLFFRILELASKYLFVNEPGSCFTFIGFACHNVMFLCSMCTFLTCYSLLPVNCFDSAVCFQPDLPV